MILKLLEIHSLPDEEDIEKALEDVSIIEIWEEKTTEERRITKVLITPEDTEFALDTLQNKFSGSKNFRIIVHSTEATIPRPEEKEEEIKEKKTETDRKSVEEIYQSISENTQLSKTFVILISLASIVASIGIMRDDVAIIIGSMVIAPLINPIMALSLATTLSDRKLGQNALSTSIIGFLIAIGIGVLFGTIFSVDPNSPQILARTDVSHLFVLLALSAGVAGSLSMTKGISTALVGVMVAVALLPPLVASGLLLGSHHWTDALEAFLLFSVYVVSLNLAGVVTFVGQGIDPRIWWKKEKAKKEVRNSILFWSVLLTILMLIIYFYPTILG